MEIPQNSRNSPIISGLFHKKRMHDICLLVNARNILEWPVLSVNLAAKMRVDYYLGPLLQLFRVNLP